MARSLAVFAIALVTCDSPPREYTAPLAPGKTDPAAWSIVVLPDTQGYTESRPDIFAAQTAWIAEHSEALDIRFVLHVGDVTNWSTEKEWQVAADAFASLVGLVPFALVPGNHDYDRSGPVRKSPLSKFFSPADFPTSPGESGLYDPASLDNSFQTFGVGREEWLVLALEWGPRSDVLRWANEVLDAHPDHEVIVLTHAYLYLDGSRYDWARKGAGQDWNPHAYPPTAWPDVNDGEEMWRSLIRARANVRLVIAGHASREGVARLTSTSDTGDEVHQLLANYQDYDEGGAGYLRVLRFTPERIDVYTYSPWLDQYRAGPQEHFSLSRP